MDMEHRTLEPHLPPWKKRTRYGKKNISHQKSSMPKDSRMWRLAQVMKNDPKFGMRILGQEVGTKVLFKFLGGVVAVYAFLAPKLFERGDSE